MSMYTSIRFAVNILSCVQDTVVDTESMSTKGATSMLLSLSDIKFQQLLGLIFSGFIGIY
jgi:hypothetical protein